MIQSIIKRAKERFINQSFKWVDLAFAVGRLQALSEAEGVGESSKHRIKSGEGPSYDAIDYEDFVEELVKLKGKE